MTDRDDTENDATEEPAEKRSVEEKPSVELRLTFADGTNGQLGLHYETDEALLLGFDKMMGLRMLRRKPDCLPIIPTHLHHLIPGNAPAAEEVAHG